MFKFCILKGVYFTVILNFFFFSKKITKLNELRLELESKEAAYQEQSLILTAKEIQFETMAKEKDVERERAKKREEELGKTILTII